MYNEIIFSKNDKYIYEISNKHYIPFKNEENIIYQSKYEILERELRIIEFLLYFEVLIIINRIMKI